MITNKTSSRLNFLAITAVFLCVGIFIFVGIAQNKTNVVELNDGVQLSIVSSKNSYLLGETVFFDFEVKNNSSEDIRVKGLDLNSRYITVYIAGEGEQFKQYKHTRVKDSVGGVFKSGAIRKSKSGILWNFSPLESTTVNSWEELGKTHILTYYAFPEPGTYSVKAVLGIPSAENLPRLNRFQFKLQSKSRSKKICKFGI